MTPASPPPLDLQALRRDLDSLPSLPWELWTSCSFRRIHNDGGEILGGYNQRSDGHPDLTMSEDKLFALVRIVNAVPALLAAKEAAESAAGWRPIADVPRDRTPIDVWIADDEGGYRVTDLRCNLSGGLIDDRGCTADLPRWPTHWMRPPALSSGGAG